MLEEDEGITRKLHDPKDLASNDVIAGQEFNPGPSISVTPSGKAGRREYQRKWKAAK
jgi:hypothetical protein